MRPEGFSWWWPTRTWARVCLTIWLLLCSLTVIIAGPVGAFINMAVWYLMVIGVRFVYLQAAKARSVTTGSHPDPVSA
jgi:uncharacterized membrane protein